MSTSNGRRSLTIASRAADIPDLAQEALNQGDLLAYWARRRKQADQFDHMRMFINRSELSEMAQGLTLRELVDLKLRPRAGQHPLVQVVMELCSEYALLDEDDHGARQKLLKEIRMAVKDVDASLADAVKEQVQIILQAAKMGPGGAGSDPETPAQLCQTMRDQGISEAEIRSLMGNQYVGPEE